MNTSTYAHLEGCTVASFTRDKAYLPILSFFASIIFNHRFLILSCLLLSCATLVPHAHRFKTTPEPAQARSCHGSLWIFYLIRSTAHDVKCIRCWARHAGCHGTKHLVQSTLGNAVLQTAQLQMIHTS